MEMLKVIIGIVIAAVIVGCIALIVLLIKAVRDDDDESMLLALCLSAILFRGHSMPFINSMLQSMDREMKESDNQRIMQQNMEELNRQNLDTMQQNMEEMNRQNPFTLQQQSDFFMDECRKAGTTFEMGGYDMSFGNSFNNFDGGGMGL